MDYKKLDEIIDDSLSHISNPVAEIAKKQLRREIMDYHKSIVEDLEHFKNTTIGLWATDKEPNDKTDFFRIE
jgi:hypothetical protein